MRSQAGFLDIDERLRQLSAKGDSLERLDAIIDFELFRPDLEGADLEGRCRARIAPRAAGRRLITG
jgi:hypothetical protein